MTPPFYGGLGGRRKLPELRGVDAFPWPSSVGGGQTLPPPSCACDKIYV